MGMGSGTEGEGQKNSGLGSPRAWHGRATGRNVAFKSSPML